MFSEYSSQRMYLERYLWRPGGQFYQNENNVYANFYIRRRKDGESSLTENKWVKGRTILYVCRNKVCKLPVEDVEKALEQLRYIL